MTAREDEHPPREARVTVTVSDTGDATAASGGTAVTGYRGPGAGYVATHTPVHQSGTGGATATGGGFANSGYIGSLAMQRTPQEPASWPHQVGLIPPAARSFQHRAEAERLRAKVDGGGTAVLTQLLTGMGGVGKTQLAADYARTAWDDGLDVLVWVTASGRSPIVGAYAQAGVELCRADPNDPEKAARSFLAWLAPKAATSPCRWLIVLDDVSDPDDLRGLRPPDSPHGRTLITTRRRDAALAADSRVDVGLFTQDEALAYLTASLTGHGESTDDLAALAHDVGYLPLGLSQAAAYLIDTGESVAAYRDLLADRTTALADATPDALPDDQALPLAAAWSLSIERADNLRPVGLARPMLQLAAFLDANGIPEMVLTSDPALSYLTEHRAQEPVSPRDAVRALRALHRLSLIDHAPDTPHQAVHVHQLIQRATRDTLAAHEYDQTARAAADALLAAWPDIERDTALAEALRDNATALTRSAEEALYRPDAHVVLYRLGNSLGDAGQVTAARDHYQHLVQTTRHRLGPDHPDTLTARGNLAHCRGEAGDPAGAADALTKLLKHMVRALGNDHPNTLGVRNNLARWQGEAGDPAGAADALTKLLADRVRVLGNDHPDTLAARNNLAHWQGEAGDPAGAADAYADLLEHMVQVLGDDHPKTLAARNNLAHWQGKAGDAAGAVKAFAELLEHIVRVLGDDHPRVRTVRRNLDRWRGEAEKAARSMGHDRS
ncbi:tetratricopeptide repeat protein [Streptomyces sp. UNOC14_S4]|uniref:tetratricopeptide repeat protein n=1 Tax=Streptomyces sp. UNOC14_S4 TaxID=2872340 RepID=UPI001E3FA8F7|nr:tetratricopeptide repeat protein [Streptomyces sp. UNOC14_S4]MCC3768211.1 tetratricopeptide repeat protein [Streptomyces sp. UNOC14_S4]